MVDTMASVNVLASLAWDQWKLSRASQPVSRKVYMAYGNAMDIKAEVSATILLGTGVCC